MSAALTVDARVGLIVGVAPWAVCLRGISSPSGRGTDASDDVLARTDGFQVIGANASRHATEVIEGESRSDRRNEPLVDRTMGFDHPAIDGGLPIAISVNGARPVPARFGFADMFLGSLGERYGWPANAH